MEREQLAMNRMTKQPNRSASGFTLVELMITLVISGVIAGAIYSTYLVQQHAYLVQDQVAEMQQNIRAAMLLLSRDIRTAGYNNQENIGSYGIISALHNKFSFTADLNNDGGAPGAGESFTYEVFTTGGISALRRITGQGAIADNIEAIEFRYLDSAGNDLGDTSVVPTGPVPINSLAKIRSVQVSILARGSKVDRKFTNSKVYIPASGNPWDLNGAAAGNAPNDHYRRRLLITTIQCRNMGI